MPSGKLTEIALWSTTPGNNGSGFTGIWPEGMAPSAVNDAARQNLADIRGWYETAQWIDYGYSISFVSTTVFKFHDADRRSLAEVNRRIRAGVGTGSIYGSITDTTFSTSDTQVTVSWDSGQLDSSLSYVALGIITPTQGAQTPFSDTSPIVVGGTDRTKKVRVEADGISTATTRVWTAPDYNVNLGINGETEDTAPDLGADYLHTYDSSATGLKKILIGRAGGGVLSTEQASTSGTSIDFTSIPSWVKHIIIMLDGVSLSGTANILVQIGDSGGIETTGYTSTSIIQTASGSNSAAVTSTSGYAVQLGAAATTITGKVRLALMDATNTWVADSNAFYSTNNICHSSGIKATSATLDRVRITTTNGTDTFDAGSINILYM